MDPKNQLTSDNNYNPSKRASAAVRTAQGEGGGYVDGPNEDTAKPDKGVKAPANADQPKNPVGGKAPRESAQYGSDELGSATGAVTRKPVEKGSV